MMQTVLLGDIGRVITGKTPPKANPEYWGDELDFITPTDFKDSKYIMAARKLSKSGIGAMRRVVCPADSIIVTCIGSDMGKVALSKKSFVSNQQINTLIVDPSKANPHFVYYLLKMSRSLLRKYAESGGSTMPIINKTTFERLSFNIPDLETQKKIADILGTIDEKIELNRKMNETLEQMGQALFRHYFIDSTEGAEEQRCILSDIVTLNPRESISKNSQATYLEMKNMPEVGMSVKAVETRSYSSGMKFRNDDTLLARITPCLENGKTAFVDFLAKGEVGFGSTEYIVMRPKKSILTEYVYFLARSDTFRAHAMRSMVGTSGRQRVQGDSIARYELTSPDDYLLNQFHEKMRAVFNQVRYNAEQIQTLTTLRDTLLPRLINGKVKL